MTETTCRQCGEPLAFGRGHNSQLDVCNVCLAEMRLANAGKLPSEEMIYGVLVHETATRRNASAGKTDGREWYE